MNPHPPLRCPSHAISRAWQERRTNQQHTMATGPHLDEDTHTIIIPSEWYNPTAAAFWRKQGFHWNNGSSTWERDTRHSLNGKLYTPEAWLKSARDKFYHFWPTLLCNCRRCGRRFARINEYQIHCENCTRQRQEAHDRHFHN